VEDAQETPLLNSTTGDAQTTLKYIKR